MKYRSKRIRYKSKGKKASQLLLPILLLAAFGLFLQIRWTQSHQSRFVNKTMVHFLKSLRPERTFTIMCPICQGTGELSSGGGRNQHVTCPVCFGLGFHRVLIQNDLEAVCPRCGGMGRILTSNGTDAVTCPLCKGRGIIQRKRRFDHLKGSVRTVFLECGDCDGLGTIRDIHTGHQQLCPVCWGLKFHEVRLMTSNDVVCPACGGMGSIYYPETGHTRLCKRCKGRGVIYNNESQPGPAAARPVP